ncbi:hypothetical protein L917_09140, partial [Phytophthora nicotianae]
TGRQEGSYIFAMTRANFRVDTETHTELYGTTARPPHWQCRFTTNCQGKPAIKRDGGYQSMCEYHREYQRQKITERRAAKTPKDFGPTQCRYPAGCGKERALKKTGVLHNYCEFDRQRLNEIQRRRQNRERALKREEARRRQPVGGSGRSKDTFRSRCRDQDDTNYTLCGLAEINIAGEEETLRRTEADKRFRETCAAIWAAHTSLNTY